MTLHVVPGGLAERVDAICDRNLQLEGPLLPILHEVQADFGYVPEEALRQIAGRLNISRAEIHGVATFYHDFRHKPAGRHVMKMCRAEACQAVGSEALANLVENKTGVSFGNTSADGAITIEAVYCLGLCACGPAALVDGVVVGRLTETKLDHIIAECRK
ncbi:MAG: formate dehydrogenase subunit gamma [Notoacmeibacter sp.]